MQKTKERRYEDFFDYCIILQDAVASYEKCSKKRKQDTFIKVMLFSLRALFGRKSGLIDEICNEHNLGVMITFEGVVDLPETNPLRKDRDVTLSNYLDNQTLTLNSKRFSPREFILGIC